MGLENLLKSVKDGIHELIQSIFGAALDFVSALAASIEKNGGSLLQKAALAAVKAAEDAGGSGSDKFDAAFDQVVEVLKNEGIPIVINAINGAIEAAVAEIKSEEAK